MVSSAVAVTLSRNPHTYILHMDVEGDMVVLIAYRDDGHRYIVAEKVDELDASVHRLVDKVAKMIIEDEDAEMFEIITGSGLLNMLYIRRRA